MWASLLGKAGWSYIVSYGPRGRPVKYNHVYDEYNHEEEEDDDDDSDREQVAAVDVFNEEVEEVDHPNVVD